ncbi:MAG: carboxypeptidase regulatory-like domain-containing protein, partial [Betaproteobacteria bacterium]
MLTRRLLLLPLIGLAFPALAQLAGRVVSPDGALEGVVVSARKAGSPVTTSVVSGADGRYSFPAAKLEPGSYALRIRASGYELEGPQSVDLGDGANAALELKLRKAADLGAQLTNAEWLASFPGSADQKKFLYSCVGCHTLERIAKSNHDAAGFVQVMKRMAGYANNSHVERPQARLVARDPMRDFGPNIERDAAYLATVNKSSGSQTPDAARRDRRRGRHRVVLDVRRAVPGALRPSHFGVHRVPGAGAASRLSEGRAGSRDRSAGQPVALAHVPVRRGEVRQAHAQVHGVSAAEGPAERAFAAIDGRAAELDGRWQAVDQRRRHP